MLFVSKFNKMTNENDSKKNKKVDPFEEIIQILDNYDEGNPPRTLDDYEEGCG